MHIQTKTVVLVILSTWMWANFSAAQNQFQMPEINPSVGQTPMTDQPTFESPQQSKPTELPPITPSSIYDNELRSEPTRQPPKQNYRSFDSQPAPPIRKTAQGNFGPALRPQQARTQQARTQQTNQLTSQNPLQQLNPNRLQEGNLSTTAPTAPTAPTLQRFSSSTTATNGNNGTQRSIMSSRISSDTSDSSEIRQATYNDPARQNVGSKNIARDLLSIYDVSSSTRPLPGVPVSLKDLMGTTPVRFRHAMVQQYWETYFDWATLTNRMEYAKWLNQISNPRRPVEQKLMNTARSMAKNDVMAAEIQLAKSQSKLQQISRSQTNDLLPLPLNQPLVGKYKSHYDWYQSRNLIPAKLKGINEMLPRTYELLDLRASTVTQAENARKQFKNSFANGNIGFGDLLESGRVWQNARQSFVSTLVSYNQAISDYALTITSAQKPIDQIVSMLVAKPKSVNEVAAQNSILERQARQSAPQRLPQQPRIAAQQNLGNQNRILGTQPIAHNSTLQSGSTANSNSNFSSSGSANPQSTSNQNPVKLSPQFQTPRQPPRRTTQQSNGFQTPGRATSSTPGQLGGAQRQTGNQRGPGQRSRNFNSGGNSSNFQSGSGGGFQSGSNSQGAGGGSFNGGGGSKSNSGGSFGGSFGG